MNKKVRKEENEDIFGKNYDLTKVVQTSKELTT